MKSKESQEQQALIKWCAAAKCKYPNLDRIYAIPNGAWVKNKWEGSKLKREGMRAGVPDLFLPVPKHGYHGLYIELKHGKNTAQPNQKEWIEFLNSMGYKAVVAWEFKGAKEAIENYYSCK